MVTAAKPAQGAQVQGAAEMTPKFETDSNGMLMMERVINKTAWNNTADEKYFHVTMAVAGNYYPLASPGMVRVREQQKQQEPRMLSVLTDRAQGRMWVMRFEALSTLWHGRLMVKTTPTTTRRTKRDAARVMVRPVSRPPV